MTATRAIAACLVATGCVAGCETPVDLRTPWPDAGVAAPPITGLSFGPAVPLFLGGGSFSPAADVASDGRDWLVVSTVGEVQARREDGALGSVWTLPDLDGELFNAEVPIQRISIAGTDDGYVFAWTTVTGSVRLAWALSDGTVIESGWSVAPSSTFGRSRAMLARAGADAWMAIESCRSKVPACTVRLYRVSLDALGAGVTTLVCEACTGGDDPYDVAPGTAVLAGTEAGFVLGWSDGDTLRYRVMPGGAPATRNGGRSVAVHRLAPEEIPELRAVAHGARATMAWRAGGEVYRETVLIESGEVEVSAEHVAAAGGWFIGLVPLGDDVVVVARTDAAVLFSADAARRRRDFPWAPRCAVASSTGGPSARAMIICVAFGFPPVWEISDEGATNVSATFMRDSTLPDVLLACEDGDCGLASSRHFRTTLETLRLDALERDLRAELGSEPLRGLVRSGRVTYVGLGGTHQSSQRALVAVDEAGGIVREPEVGPLAMTPDGAGGVLFVDAPDGEWLRLWRWDAAAADPEALGEGQALMAPADLAARCPMRTPDCWLSGNVALASGAGGTAAVWIDHGGTRLAASTRAGDLPMTGPRVIEGSAQAKTHPTVAVVGAHAIVAWEQEIDRDTRRVGIAAADMATGTLRSLGAGVLGTQPRLATVGDVAVLVWRSPSDELRAARIDAQGTLLDPTDSRALSVERCASFGISPVDARRAAVWCRAARAITLRPLYLPEELR